MNVKRMACLGLLAATWPLAAQEKLNLASEFPNVPSGVDACNDGENSTQCVIDIEIRPEGTDGCTVRLRNDNLDLITFAKGVTDKFVYWRIAAQDVKPGEKPYRFQEYGVVFTNDRPPKNFVAGKRGNDLISYRWKNKNKTKSVFNYVIFISNETDSEPATRECQLDPWIRNRAT